MSRTPLHVCIFAVCFLALAASLGSHSPLEGRNFISAITPVGSRSSFSLPFAFEPNLGQADSRVAFIGRGRGLTVLLDRREIAFHVAAPARVKSSLAPRIISMRLAGQGIFAWRGAESLRGESNYFIGNDRRRWRAHVPHFAQAIAATTTPGVGIVLYGSDDGVEYDLRVEPGADLDALRFEISGADSTRLTPAGDILLINAGAELRMKKPVVYQQFARNVRAGMASVIRKRVDAAYILHTNGSLGFRVGAHDPRAALIIDPSISVAYATFLGGAGADAASSVALDAAGNVYIGGTTTSPGTFPGSPHALGPGGGASEFFIAKIDPAATGAKSLVYLTFLGGSQTQTGGLIAATAGGSVAITGTTTSADFPVTDSSLPTNALSTGIGNDVAVSEIDPTGAVLVFSTLFGGSGIESENGNGGIALGPSGNVYVASDTNPTTLDTTSPDLPVTTGAYATTWDGQESDGFLAIFTPPAQSGGAATLKYCSYLGTNALARVSVGGVAVDSTGSAYIAGGVENATSAFPFTNDFQAVYGGGDSDAFVMKLAPQAQNNVDLVYATLLGGSGTDQALAIALDTSPNPTAYVTGATSSPNFPANGQQPAFSASLNPNATANAFLTVIAQSATGQTSLLYSTYLGGSSSDAGQSLSVAAPNEVYVAGTTSSWDFPWHDNVQPFNGQSVAFVAKLDPTSSGLASLVYATPLGGTSSASGNAGAIGNAVAADSSGHVYLAGAATSPDFPTAVTTSGKSLNGSQSSCASCLASPPASDAFLAEFLENSAPQPALTFSQPRLVFLNTRPQASGLTNTGEAALNISSLSIAGPSAADFSLIGQSACTSQALNPGASCPFEINFSPSGTGYESAIITVTDNAPGSPQEFEVLGVSPGLAALPISVTFPSQASGAPSDPQQVTFTVTSPTKQILTIDAAPSLGGTNPADFQLSAASSGCPTAQPLNSNFTCAVNVVFVPQAAGSFQSEIDVSYHFQGGSEQSLVVPLSGTAVATLSAAISVVPSVNFGGQLAQTAGTAQPITITNSATGTNAGPLVFTGVSLKGTSSSDFDITSNSCSAAGTPPGGACTVQIAFRPLAAPTCGTDSTRSATLSLSDNAPASPQSVALTGTAEDFCFSAPTGQATSAPVAPGATATYNLEVNSSSGFTGSVALSCSGAPSEATCNLSASSVNVTPSAPAPFTVSVPTTAPTTVSSKIVPQPRHPKGGNPNFVVVLFLAAIVLLTATVLLVGIVPPGASSQRRAPRWKLVRSIQAFALLFALGASIAACGGGGGSAGSSDPPDPGTPPGTYTITVTATVTASSTTVTRTIQLPLTVN